MEERKNEPNIRKFYEAIATIYSRRYGVEITVKSIRRRDDVGEDKRACV